MAHDGGDASPRRAHKTLEPLHTVVYFVPEAAEVYRAAGVKGGMRGYVATRSAPLGRVAAEVVVATFYNFSPATVGSAIPSVWEVTTPEDMLRARLEVADTALRRLLGDDVVASGEMAEAAALAREATTALRPEGRALYAGHAALPWPDPAHLQLWHAVTLLREHRGDGHIAALVLAGLDGLDASLTYLPLGTGMPEEMQRTTRGWSEQEWAAGKQRLRDRGLLGADGDLTDAGRAQREVVEAQTDAAAAAPWEHLSVERTQRLRELCRPWSRSLTEQIWGGGGR